MASSTTDNLLSLVQQATSDYKSIKITNFTTSWSSGLAFCALLHRFDPDLIAYDSLKASEWEKNLAAAFDAAERVGIARLLDVEDMLISMPDPLSVATYVSEMISAFRRKSPPDSIFAQLGSGANFGTAVRDWAEDQMYQNREQVDRRKIVLMGCPAPRDRACFVCREPFAASEEKTVEIESNIYHAHCLSCDSCNKNLTKFYILLDSDTNTNTKSKTNAKSVLCEACGRRAFVMSKNMRSLGAGRARGGVFQQAKQVENKIDMLRLQMNEVAQATEKKLKISTASSKSSLVNRYMQQRQEEAREKRKAVQEVKKNNTKDLVVIKENIPVVNVAPGSPVVKPIVVDISAIDYDDTSLSKIKPKSPPSSARGPQLVTNITTGLAYSVREKSRKVKRASENTSDVTNRLVEIICDLTEIDEEESVEIVRTYVKNVPTLQKLSLLAQYTDAHHSGTGGDVDIHMSRSYNAPPDQSLASKENVLDPAFSPRAVSGSPSIPHTNKSTANNDNISTPIVTVITSPADRIDKIETLLGAAKSSGFDDIVNFVLGTVKYSEYVQDEAAEKLVEKYAAATNDDVSDPVDIMKRLERAHVRSLAQSEENSEFGVSIDEAVAPPAENGNVATTVDDRVTVEEEEAEEAEEEEVTAEVEEDIISLQQQKNELEEMLAQEEEKLKSLVMSQAKLRTAAEEGSDDESSNTSLGRINKESIKANLFSSSEDENSDDDKKKDEQAPVVDEAIAAATLLQENEEDEEARLEAERMQMRFKMYERMRAAEAAKFAEEQKDATKEDEDEEEAFRLEALEAQRRAERRARWEEEQNKLFKADNEELDRLKKQRAERRAERARLFTQQLQLEDEARKRRDAERERVQEEKRARDDLEHQKKLLETERQYQKMRDDLARRKAENEAKDEEFRNRIASKNFPTSQNLVTVDSDPEIDMLLQSLRQRKANKGATLASTDFQLSPRRKKSNSIGSPRRPKPLTEEKGEKNEDDDDDPPRSKIGVDSPEDDTILRARRRRQFSNMSQSVHAMPGFVKTIQEVSDDDDDIVVRRRRTPGQPDDDDSEWWRKFERRKKKTQVARQKSQLEIEAIKSRYSLRGSGSENYKKDY